MSFEPDDKNSEAEASSIAEESLNYLKVIATLLAEMQDADVRQILNDIKGL